MLQKKNLAVALALALIPGFAVGQEANQVQPQDTQQEAVQDDDTTRLEGVTVTGSNLSRSEVETASPVVTISSDDIKAEGFTTVEDILMTAAQSTGNVDTELDMTGSTPNGKFVNLRGLGPQYTLVLLNGKRMADYPQAYDFRSTAVSLSSIPVGAIDRIEILSGGASAIYGSDAVAGVINIITKSNYDGNELHLRGGTTTRGGGQSYTLQFTGGKTEDKWNVTYAFQYQRKKPIMAFQRDFMDTTYNNPAFRDDPSKAPASEAVRLVQVEDDGTESYLWPDKNGNLVNSTNAMRYACNHTNPNYRLYRSSKDMSTVDRCGDVSYAAQRTIRNGKNQLSGLISGNYSISDETKAYYTIMASRSKDSANNTTMFNFYMPEQVYDPSLGTVYANRTVTPDEVGGQMPHKYSERAYGFNVGLQGIFMDGRFDWDVSLGRSGYNMSIDRRNFVTQRLNKYFLGESLGTNADGQEIHNVRIDRLFSPMSPEDYNDISTVFTNKGESSISNIQGMTRGELFDLPAGTVEMAIIMDAVHEKYVLTPDVRTTPDHTGERIFNWTAVNAGGSRNRYALGTEFHVPIVSSLSANLAGRYDKYADKSDVGGAFTWQAGLEWRPTSSLLLRSTYATSFRAPDLTYLYTDHSSNFYSLVDVYKCRRDGIPSTSPDCLSGSSDYQDFVEGEYEGNQDLKEERGKSFTAGFIWDVTDSMSLSMDYYRIELDNAVSEIDSNFLMMQDADCLLGKTESGEAVDQNSPSCEFYTGLVTRDTNPNGDQDITNYASYPINQSKMRTEGIDSSWNYSFHMDSIGDFRASVKYTIVKKLESQLFPGDDFVNERDNLQYSNFRSKVNWQITWNKDNNWNASVYGYRWGSLPNYAKTGRIAPYIIWNAYLGKQITKNMRMGIQVNNLFDKIHPNDNTYTSYPYFGHFYSPIGRQIYGEITYDF